jgi:predicted Zn-dependent protease
MRDGCLGIPYRLRTGGNSDAYLALGTSTACQYVTPDPPRPRPVYIADLGPHPTISAQELVAFCRDKLHLTVEQIAALPADGVTEDPERHQMAAEDVIAMASQQLPQILGNPDAILIVITDRDMYVRQFSWKFAFSLRRDDRVAVISTARLNPTFLGGPEDRNVLWSRTTKVLQRDLAQLYYRLPSNDDPGSLLNRAAPSVTAIDRMGCAFGAAELERIGRKSAADGM